MNSQARPSYQSNLVPNVVVLCITPLGNLHVAAMKTINTSVMIVDTPIGLKDPTHNASPQ